MKEKIVLDQEQIDYLFVFCRKHYVRYYDVQIELVDHLANAIEEKLNANNNLSFDKALDEVYATFGYKGFAGIVEAKANTLSKQYSKLRWKYFFEYFTIPKILFTLMVCIGLYVIGNVVTIENLRIVIATIVFSIWCIEFFYSRKIYKQTKQIKKEMLMLSIGTQTQTFFSLLLFQILYISIPFTNRSPMSILQYWLLSSFAVILILTDFAQIEMNKQIITKAKQDYPLAFE